MSKSATYTFKLNTAKVKQVERNAIFGLITMGYDINNRAKSKAPVLSGALINSIRVDTSEEKSGTVYVLAGGVVGPHIVPYAKRREFENNKHPNTKHYMGNGFQEITSDYSKYFKGITE